MEDLIRNSSVKLIFLFLLLLNNLIVNAQQDSVLTTGFIYSQDIKLKEPLSDYIHYYLNETEDTVFFVPTKGNPTIYVKHRNKWAIYYSNGRIREIGRFVAKTKKKRVLRNYQVKKGRWKVYNYAGDLLKIEIYKKKLYNPLPPAGTSL